MSRFKNRLRNLPHLLPSGKIKLLIGCLVTPEEILLLRRTKESYSGAEDTVSTVI